MHFPERLKNFYLVDCENEICLTAFRDSLFSFRSAYEKLSRAVSIVGRGKRFHRWLFKLFWAFAELLLSFIRKPHKNEFENWYQSIYM